MADDSNNAAQMISIPLGMAGRVFTLHTDSVHIAEISSEFFALGSGIAKHPSRADVTLCIGSHRDNASKGRCYPVFRGRNQFVHADYGREGFVSFDLKARQIMGALSSDLVDDANRFRREVLCVVAGLLAPAFSILGLHAGCIVKDGRAVLLAASSGVGKSTLSLALAQCGWSLLSDDWTFVAEGEDGLRTWGMQTSLKLLPDAVRHFPQLSALSPARALNGEMSFEIDPWKFFDVSRATDSTPVGVVLLERDHEESDLTGVYASECDASETLATLSQEIEEQPQEICAQEDYCEVLLQRMSYLPSMKVRFHGPPDSVAAYLDPLLTATFIDNIEETQQSRNSLVATNASTRHTTVMTHASTDMLHRRAPLPYSFPLTTGRGVIRITTDSKLISDAIRTMKELRSPTDETFDGEWKIAIETSTLSDVTRSTGSPSESVEIAHLGASSFLRTVNGSWFAHESRSLSGVGFARLTGGDADQLIVQLAVYLSAIVGLFADANVEMLVSANGSGVSA